MIRNRESEFLYFWFRGSCIFLWYLVRSFVLEGYFKRLVYRFYIFLVDFVFFVMFRKVYEVRVLWFKVNNNNKILRIKVFEKNKIFKMRRFFIVFCYFCFGLCWGRLNLILLRN